MSEHDEKLDRAYRALANEEPPASLDAAILAASRRAVARPSLARRWAVPVSLAATLVLVVGVTLEMQHEQPGVALSLPERKREMPVPQSAPEPAQTNAPTTPEASTSAAPEASGGAEARGRARAEPEAKTIAAPPAKPQEAQPPRDEKDRTPAASVIARPAPEAAQGAERYAPSPATARVAPPAPAPQSAARSSAKRAAGANVAADLAQDASPHDALEKIAKLRAEGRDDEADRALEAFRKRNPDYRIDEAMWARVKPR
jgi:hypothetical protein